MQWCFSQVKGAIDDDVAEGKTQTLGFQSWASVSSWARSGCWDPSLCGAEARGELIGMHVLEGLQYTTVCVCVWLI